MTICSCGDEKMRQSATSDNSPYRLRDHSKPPARFRDYVDDGEFKDFKSQAKNKRVRNQTAVSPAKRIISSASQGSSKSTTETRCIITTAPAAEAKPIKVGKPSSQSTSSKTQVISVNNITRINRPRHGRVDIADSIKDNLRRLKNVLKLPKARRWVYCEFFYSGVDQQIFSGDSDFPTMLRDSFPNLRCKKLRRSEWRVIRRLIGRPRRCSEAFLSEEREALHNKRAKIRQIYEGSVVDISNESLDLPKMLPRALAVGMKIYARVRDPKDGIYAGTIDAIMHDSYRVVFDKEETIPPLMIKDYEVMAEQKTELLSITYFLEQNKAAAPSVLSLGSNILHSLSYQRASEISQTPPSSSRFAYQKMIPSRDEKVGNFPVRMLVVLVKLSKLIDAKKKLIRQLTDLNNEAEKINLLSDSYPVEFQIKYAQVVLTVESLNKQLSSYVAAIHEYKAMLLPSLGEVSVTSRPEAFRKICQTHATQIVKHCNNGLNVQNKHSLSLAVSLTALLLQIKALGQHCCSPYDFKTVQDTLLTARKHIYPSNMAAFQDDIEVHIKHVHNLINENFQRKST